MNILFDLDGTLTDPFEGISNCIEFAMTGMDRPCPPLPTLTWCIGPPLKQSLAQLLGTDDDALAQQALDLYRERFSRTGLFENRVYPDIPDVLTELNMMGHTLYVATAKPTVFATKIISHFGLKQYFKAVFGSELDGTRTNKSDLIAWILQNEKLDPADVVMIGDRKQDIIGARANSIPGIGVLWGYGTLEELTAAGAAVCIKRPVDLAGSLRLTQD